MLNYMKIKYVKYYLKTRYRIELKILNLELHEII